LRFSATPSNKLIKIALAKQRLLNFIDMLNNILFYDNKMTIGNGALTFNFIDFERLFLQSANFLTSCFS